MLRHELVLVTESLLPDDVRLHGQERGTQKTADGETHHRGLAVYRWPFDERNRFAFNHPLSSPATKTTANATIARPYACLMNRGGAASAARAPSTAIGIIPRVRGGTSA